MSTTLRQAGQVISPSATQMEKQAQRRSTTQIWKQIWNLHSESVRSSLATRPLEAVEGLMGPHAESFAPSGPPAPPFSGFTEMGTRLCSPEEPWVLPTPLCSPGFSP